MSSTPAQRPRVLLLAPAPAVIEEGLAAAFDVAKLHEAQDRDAALAQIGAEIRGLASTGHVRIDGALMDRLPKLEIVASYGVGYDHVDAAEAGRRGVIVTNTPDVLNEEVADTALGLLIATIRQLPQADRYLRAGQWLKKPFPLTATLRGRRMGIVGLGRIGKAIARRAEAFGLEVVYHGRSRQAGAPYLYFPSLLDMAKDVDILMVITPGGAGTRHLIDAAVLDALGPEGVLINVARGSVVDEQALIAALRDGRILSAGLDVFENEPEVPAELIAMEHVVLLPHVGSASVACRRAMGQLVVDNLTGWFAGRGPLTPTPETPWPRA